MNLLRNHWYRSMLSQSSNHPFFAKRLLAKQTVLPAAFFMAFGVAMVSLAQDASADKNAASAAEQKFLTGTRQLTFEGARAGEGYFSRDGRYMVFQL
ncbi:MAG: hypothetical protein ACK5PZ_09160, partial [Pirellula sp.]